MTAPIPKFPLSILKKAYHLGRSDCEAKKKGNAKAHFNTENWCAIDQMYYRGFRKAAINRKVSQEDISDIIERSCHCLTWDFAPKEATDEELLKFLKNYMSEGGSSGPGSISVWYKGNGLKIWASWSGHVSAYTDQSLVCKELQTVKLARRIFNIPDPTNLQAELF